MSDYHNAELSELEKQILTDIKNRTFDDGKIGTINKYPLDSVNSNNKYQELVWILTRLKRIGYVNFIDKKLYLTGGSMNPKYNNNAVMIFGNAATITEAGESYLKK